MRGGDALGSLQQIFGPPLMARMQVLHMTILMLLMIFTCAVVGMNVGGRDALQGVYAMEQ